MSIDRSHQYLLQQHRDWLGEIQPVGLVVAPIALANAGVQLERARTLVEAQATLREFVTTEVRGGIADDQTDNSRYGFVRARGRTASISTRVWRDAGANLCSNEFFTDTGNALAVGQSRACGDESGAQI
ncbi:MAG: hypothetical protein ACFB4I_20460 [Cyanophyceae cyanobacterium]